jgi:hypothetical protein
MQQTRPASSADSDDVNDARKETTTASGQASDASLILLDYTEAEERKVIRKVDAYLLPILTLLYLLSFLDR